MKYFNETYRKREFLTRNEWADTYRATHSSTDEHVTLKVLAKKSNDEEYINNLLKEIEIIKTIKNPNLIHVNNMFKYSGLGKIYYYIEAEYFKGDSLKEVIENSKIDKREAAKIVERVAEGVKEFHDKNILFNSLNLENILMNSREVIKIDILSYLENKSFKMKENEYSEENNFNSQKDIYALGEVLYCLLSGNLIFDPNKYKKDIKDDILIKIIDRATNPECESRYVNINEMIIDLKLYLQTGNIRSDNFTYNDRNLAESKKKKKQKKKKEKNEKKSKQEKNEDKGEKGKLSKIFIVCTTVALLAGAAVYSYEYLEKNSFGFNKTNVSNESNKDKSNKSKLNNEIKEQDENKGIQTKKKEIQKEQINNQEENKITSSNKIKSKQKSEITFSSNNSNKDNNTSSTSNNSSSNTNLNNNSSSNISSNSNNNSTNNNSSNTQNYNQSLDNTANTNEVNNNTNQAIETNPEMDNVVNSIESMQESELNIQ